MATNGVSWRTQHLYTHLVFAEDAGLEELVHAVYGKEALDVGGQVARYRYLQKGMGMAFS